MSREISLQTRREFLRTTLLGGAVTWTVPAFLANTFAALGAEAAERGPSVVTGRDSTILIVLQMAGGNDGLNTVVPCDNDHYHRARPRLGLKPAQVLRLADGLGLHPSLKAFKELYDEGELSIVQGVGYPNPNRSHFRSTEIWQTASDSNRFERHGWIGRYFDNACDGCGPTVGVSMGRQMPQAFTAKAPKGISLENPQGYRFMEGKRGDAESAAEDWFRKINEMDDPATNSGGSIGELAGSTPSPGSVLEFVERTALDAQVSADQVRAISARVQTQGQYPSSKLGNSLRLVARLIGGRLPTRVFYVSQGGYDTHTNQAPAQERLLRDLGDSLKAFRDDMKEQGNTGRVLVMTFSEFGRRVSENASGGTDHGAAAPLFILGGKVKAGLLGACPSLAPADLFQGDLRHTVDFRSVYATLLERWLGTAGERVLRRKFPLLDVI